MSSTGWVGTAGIAALFFVCLLLVAALHWPAPCPSESGKVDDSHSEHETHSPDATNGGTPPSSHERAPKCDSPETDGKTPAKGLWATLTALAPTPDGWVALFTFFLLIFTWRQLTNSEEETDQRIRIERAYFKAGPDRMEGWSPNWETFGQPWETRERVGMDLPVKHVKFAWSITNTGNSPGWLISGTTFGPCLVTNAPYPDDPPYPPPSNFPDTVIPPGGNHGVERFLPVPKSDYDLIMNGSKSFMFVGKVIWRDIFGETQTWQVAHEWRLPMGFTPGPGGYLLFGPGGPSNWTRYDPPPRRRRFLL